MTSSMYEKRYWMRVLILMRAIVTGWRKLPESLSTAKSSGYEFALDLWHLLLNIVLPLTFLAAPIWLWLLERDSKRNKKKTQK